MAKNQSAIEAIYKLEMSIQMLVVNYNQVVKLTGMTNTVCESLKMYESRLEAKRKELSIKP